MNGLSVNSLAETLQPLGLTFLVIGGFWAAMSVSSVRNPIVRAVAAACCIVLAIRYLSWRVGDGVPAAHGVLATAWIDLFLAFELAGLLGACLNLFVMARTRSRHAEADAGCDSALRQAPVDVFIATYNESREILERTLLGARAIEHPDLRVWLLDDGARDWARALAVELGALYVCRMNGRHAKAGNVNNGLQAALATGRKPEFVLLLDADFVAGPTILSRTLPLFGPPDVGIVQTPQHFFNPDPIQINLLTPAVWPDEQRYFFNVLMPSLDAWGGAFCCGTSAVLRVAALRSCGGMATETVTEDMLTSFKMIEHGWRTVYLDEQLSLGLAPEGIGEYVSQRSRWCLGAIQQLHTRWSFFGRARMRWIDRLNNFSSMLYWATSFPFRLLLLCAPAAWWWTGISVISANPGDISRQMLPWLAASTLFYAYYGGNRLLPLIADVTQLVPSIAVIRTAATGLLRPWGHPFKVTAKGITSTGHTVHWQLISPFLLIVAATLGGMLANLGHGNSLRGSDGYVLNAVWSIVNTVMLGMACVACIDPPKRRRDERFQSGERGVAIGVEGRLTECRITDISLGGARLAPILAGPGAVPLTGTLWLDDGKVRVPFERQPSSGEECTVRFLADGKTRDRLILKLFDSRYKIELERVSVFRAFGAAFTKLFA